MQTFTGTVRLISRTASQRTSRSRSEGPRVAVTMQNFHAPAAAASRARPTISPASRSGARPAGVS